MGFPLLCWQNEQWVGITSVQQQARFWYSAPPKWQPRTHVSLEKCHLSPHGVYNCTDGTQELTGEVETVQVSENQLGGKCIPVRLPHLSATSWNRKMHQVKWPPQHWVYVACRNERRTWVIWFPAPCTAFRENMVRGKGLNCHWWCSTSMSSSAVSIWSTIWWQDADCAFALPRNTQLLGYALPFEAQKLEIISDTVKLSWTIWTDRSRCSLANYSCHE